MEISIEDSSMSSTDFKAPTHFYNKRSLPPPPPSDRTLARPRPNRISLPTHKDLVVPLAVYFFSASKALEHVVSSKIRAAHCLSTRWGL